MSVSVHDLMSYDPKVFTSGADEVASPIDMPLGTVVCLNGADYEFLGLNNAVLFVRRYRDPDLIGPHPRRAPRMAYYWCAVKSLHYY